MSHRRNDYSIGIVCSLAIEHAAIQALLDEEHDMLPTDEDVLDQKQYTLGSMCGHNVVIASSPMPELDSAAITAQSTIRCFPDIRFCLLVGIGSAIPSGSDDIRLGDVVVSLASGASGGAVQIDLGRRHSSKSFERLGSLNRQPLALLKAISLLQARFDLGELDLDEEISQILGRVLG